MAKDNTQMVSLKNDTQSVSPDEERCSTTFKVNKFWQAAQNISTGGSHHNEPHQGHSITR